jgi:hypothetical protein
VSVRQGYRDRFPPNPYQVEWGAEAAAADLSTGSGTSLSASAGLTSAELIFELALGASGLGWVLLGGPGLRVRFSREAFEPGWNCHKTKPNTNPKSITIPEQNKIGKKEGRTSGSTLIDNLRNAIERHRGPRP